MRASGALSCSSAAEGQCCARACGTGYAAGGIALTCEWPPAQAPPRAHNPNSPVSGLRIWTLHIPGMQVAVGHLFALEDSFRHQLLFAHRER